MWRPQRDVIVMATVVAGLAVTMAGSPVNAVPAPMALPTSTGTGSDSPSSSTSPRTSSPEPTATLPTSEPTPTPEPTTPPTTEPTRQPTEKPTEEPTEKPSSKPPEEPSEKPSPEPSDEPTDEPNDGAGDGDPNQPTAPPTQPPSTDPSEHDRQDPQEAYEAALKDAQTLAVAEAQRRLYEILANVDDAESGLEAARADATAARKADEEAQKQLKIANETVARTERRIGDIRNQTDGARDALGTVVREAYQNNGLSTVGVLLGAETPEDLSNRVVGMRTLLRVSDTALGELAEDEADLRNALSTLRGQRAEKQQIAEAAAQKRADAEQAAKKAEQARANREQKQAEYEHALQLAEEAKLEDYRLYLEQIDESTAVGEYLGGLSAEDYGPGYGTGSFVRPGTGPVTSEYGSRFHPILGYVKMHTGIDFGSGDGNIYAADSGTVIEATYNSAYGNMVIVDHGDVDGRRVSTLYAHQAGISVQVGQKVEKGQVIGTIGSTGYSTGPHLHFEVRLDGEHTEPRSWLP